MPRLLTKHMSQSVAAPQSFCHVIRSFSNSYVTVNSSCRCWWWQWHNRTQQSSPDCFIVGSPIVLLFAIYWLFTFIIQRNFQKRTSVSWMFVLQPWSS